MPGDFLLGQTGEVGEFEHLSIPCREAVQARADPPAGRHAGDGFILGGRPGERPALERLVGVSLLAADMIDRSPMHEGEQPGGRLGVLRAVAARLSPRSQKRLLNGVFGEGSVSEYSEREPESGLGVAPVEFPEGALVATRHLHEQMFVVSDGR